MKLFNNIVLEHVEPNTLYAPENEIVVYATISNPEGFEQADEVELQKEWNTYLEKEGCKARVRVITKNNDTKQFLTLKIKNDDKMHENIESSKEYTIPVDENFVNAFTLVAEDIIEKTRYVFYSKQVDISYIVNGEEKTTKLENVKYEVDVYTKVPNMCKIEVEIDSIVAALNSDDLEDKDIKLITKVSHLPFNPVNIFAKWSEGGENKVKELWDKIKG